MTTSSFFLVIDTLDRLMAAALAPEESWRSCTTEPQRGTEP